MNNENNFNENIPEEPAADVTPPKAVSEEAAPEIPAEENLPEAPAEATPAEEAAPENEELIGQEVAPEEIPEATGQYYAPYPPQPQYAPYPQQPQYPYPPQGRNPNGAPSYDPGYNQPYPPQPMNPYPPQYGQAPGYYQQPNYGYAPPRPPKARLSGGVKAFITIMAVLTVLGFGAFGLALVLYGNSTAAPSSGEESPHDYNGPRYEDFFGNNPNGGDYSEFYKDFYGDFFPDNENGESSESSTDDGWRIEEKDKPNIKVPEVTDGIIINNKPVGPELNAEEVYNKVLPSTVTVDVDVHYTNGQTEDSTGTGIFISEDGFVITNSHVVANSKSVSVKVITSDGKEYPAVVVGLDKTTDLAILKVDGKGFIPAEFGSADELNIGEWVIAIGNPGGSEFSGSLTRGVISGLDRLVGSYSSNGMTYIQTDAAINPGNSGGPLVNMHGQVIGINSSKIVADYYEGMGFAIPVSDAKGIIDQLLTKGYVQGRVRLGITGQNVQYGTPEGVTIIAIDEISSFAGTEAQVGDVIPAIGGEKITSLNELSNEFLKFAPGDEVEIELYRSSTGKTFTIKITLLEDKGETQR